MFKYSQITWWNIGIIVEIHSFCTIVYFFSKKKKKKIGVFLFSCTFCHICRHYVEIGFLFFSAIFFLFSVIFIRYVFSFIKMSQMPSTFLAPDKAKSSPWADSFSIPGGAIRISIW